MNSLTRWIFCAFIALSSGCSGTGQYDRDIVNGSATGASVGALIGALSGDTRQQRRDRAVIGGIVGGLTGAVAGSIAADRRSDYSAAKRELDNAISIARRDLRSADASIRASRNLLAKEEQTLSRVTSSNQSVEVRQRQALASYRRLQSELAAINRQKRALEADIAEASASQTNVSRFSLKRGELAQELAELEQRKGELRQRYREINGIEDRLLIAERSATQLLEAS